MSIYNDEELAQLGFRHLGRNVRFSTKASIHGAERISIGDNSRIDDFVVLSAGEGGISIGRNVHIGVMSTLIGGGAITLADFSNISGRVSIYSSSDDFHGAYMSNPTVPAVFTSVTRLPVTIGRHAIVGTTAVILAGCEMKEGAVLGALSLGRGTLEEFTIYAGIPAVAVKQRRRDLLEQEAAYLASELG